jgi:hypothetical protein
MADTDTAEEKGYVQAKFLRPYGYKGKLAMPGTTWFVTKVHALELRRRGIVEPVKSDDSNKKPAEEKADTKTG